MRRIWALAAIALLSGCGRDGQSESAAPEDAATERVDATYAFRLPAQRVRAVLQSNAAGCEALGPARCRIASTAYRLGDDGRVEAALALRIDPLLVRRFGEAVGTVVVDAGGALQTGTLDALDTDAPARDRAMLGRLRDALREAEASGTAEASARAVRIREALATIAEVEERHGQTLATASMLIRYSSTNALPGARAEGRRPGSDAVLADSNVKPVRLLARLLPWLLGMLAVALLLRWILHDMPLGRARRDTVYAAPPPKEPAWPPRTRANPMHRWFARDDGDTRR